MKDFLPPMHLREIMQGYVYHIRHQGEICLFIQQTLNIHSMPNTITNTQN